MLHVCLDERPVDLVGLMGVFCGGKQGLPCCKRLGAGFSCPFLYAVAVGAQAESLDLVQPFCCLTVQTIDHFQF